MSNFTIIKQNVDILDACRTYGISLDIHNKAPCPFHSEKTPSFVVNPRKQRFNCYGCNVSGDVIDLVCKIFHTYAQGAIQLLNQDFHLGLNFEKPDKRALEKIKAEAAQKARFKEWEKQAFITLCDYRRALWFASRNPKNSLFTEALQNLDKIDYYIECMEENSKEFYKLNRKVVSDIEHRRINKRNNSP